MSPVGVGPRQCPERARTPRQQQQAVANCAVVAPVASCPTDGLCRPTAGSLAGAADVAACVAPIAVLVEDIPVPQFDRASSQLSGRKSQPPADGDAASDATAPAADGTARSFTSWLAEFRWKTAKSAQDVSTEISSLKANVEVHRADLASQRREGGAWEQSAQEQIAQLRERVAQGFGEITVMVTQNAQAQQEATQELADLQHDVSCKATELDSLKESYSQAEQLLQGRLTGIENSLQATAAEARATGFRCESVREDLARSFRDAGEQLRTLEDEQTVGSSDNRSQLMRLHEQISKMHCSLADFHFDYDNYKVSTRKWHESVRSQAARVEAQPLPPAAALRQPSPLVVPGAGSLVVPSSAGGSTLWGSLRSPAGLCVPATIAAQPLQAWSPPQSAWRSEPIGQPLPPAAAQAAMAAATAATAAAMVNTVSRGSPRLVQQRVPY